MNSFQLKAKATRSIDCRTQSSLNGVSFVLSFFKFHFLPFFQLPKLRSLASKIKVSSNRSRQRKGKPSSTNLLTPFKCGGKSAKSENFGQVCRVWGHIWSSPCKAADTDCAVDMSPKRTGINRTTDQYSRSISPTMSDKSS